MKFNIPLPIDPYLEQLVEGWRNHSTLIVKSTPGSGKTTRLPRKIAEHSTKKVVVLEPRRLAAKFAAQRIAEEASWNLGSEVGYHFRFEKNYGPQTKLIFYTEGTFIRMLLSGFEELDIGTVILDEFHERHIETDVALAALRGLQEKYPDLKLILMSATLDNQLNHFFPSAHQVNIEARQFSVEVEYLPNQPSILSLPLATKIKRVLQALAADSGDVLVFVPGMREMLQVRDHLGMEFGDVLLLHGDLTKAEQDLALNPCPRRKVILATNIAESSLTIPGIKVVIDSGIQREARYSPWTGLKTLEDRPITQSSAIQRTGRAGRTSNGHCYRLYSSQDFNSREEFTVPEILKADLTDTCLLTSQLKTPLYWFTPPPPERWEKSVELGKKLGALSAEGTLTLSGREMLKYPLSSRLARTLQAGKDLSAPQKKKLLNYICETIEKDSFGTLMRRLQFFLMEKGQNDGPWEKCLLFGFIDQLAKYRKKQNDFIHYSGKILKAHHSLKDLHHDYYLILDVTLRSEAITILPIEEEWTYDVVPFPFTEENHLEVADTFKLRRLTRIGSIPMEETSLPLEWSKLSNELKEKVIKESSTPFKKRWLVWQESENFLRLHYGARVHQISMEELEELIQFKNYLNHYQTLSWNHLEDYFVETIKNVLNLPSLEEDLPRHIKLIGNKEIKVHYPFGMDPFIEAPIQDFFGLKETPSIMKGKIPLSLKLLGPHKRPIQVTKDLAGFWKKTYIDMKREWQRDYPRHHWPDAPENAKPFLLKSHLRLT